MVKIGLEKSTDDIVIHICRFCDGVSLCSLIACSTRLCDLLYEQEDLWEGLYRTYSFYCLPETPVFPGCGSWRELWIRAYRGAICVHVRPLGHPEERLTFVVDRRTTLFGLKKIVRKEQLKRFGFAMTDFELVDSRNLNPLGVQGYDSLPPSDLSILFVSTDTILANATVRRILYQRPVAWRRNLLRTPDGLELVQVFVGSEGTLQGLEIDLPTKQMQDDQQVQQSMERETPAKLKCSDTLLRMSRGELDGLVELIVDKDVHQDKKQEYFEELRFLIRDSNDTIRYNSYKPFWSRSEFHPLIYVALCAPRGSNLPFSIRREALQDVLLQYIVHLFSKDFIVNGLARGFLGNGFPAVFTRLISMLFPMIFKLQLKQILEGSIDWIPLIFATKFLIKVSLIVSRAARPILSFAFAHQAVLAFLRTVYNEETERDDLATYGILILLNDIVRTIQQKRKAWGENAAIAANVPSSMQEQGISLVRKKSSTFSLRRLVAYVFNLDDSTVSYNRVTAWIRERLWVSVKTNLPRFALLMEKLGLKLTGNILLQYLTSALIWDFAELKMPHALNASLPVYAYSVPFIVSVMLIRLRIALSDSYYYMLYV